MLRVPPNSSTRAEARNNEVVHHLNLKEALAEETEAEMVVAALAVSKGALPRLTTLCSTRKSMTGYHALSVAVNSAMFNSKGTYLTARRKQKILEGG